MDSSVYPGTHHLHTETTILEHESSQTETGVTGESSTTPAQDGPLFDNPFTIEDLSVFDEATLQKILSNGGFGITLEDFAISLHEASPELLERITTILPAQDRSNFLRKLYEEVSGKEIEHARRVVLDALFWELSYWKTPDLYEELVEGEPLHPGIFQQLEPDLRNKIVLDVGAGSGRATFECVRHGARLVYAIEPSPGLLHILMQKISDQQANGSIVSCAGRFDKLPLENNSVDTALSCSAFTADPEQGGEPGLAELERVTRPGGKIVVIWPRTQDYAWLADHGFQYVELSMPEEMQVHFRSLEIALHCAQRFYARNQIVLRYILEHQKPEVPYSVLGFNPPCDYCWLTVQ